MSALDVAALTARVQAAVPAVEAKTSDNGQPYLLVPASEIVRVATLLHDDPELRFDSLMDLTGWDLSKYPSTPPTSDLVVAYFLHSLVHRHHLTLKVQVAREAAEVPSVSAVWAVANYFEREVWDLLGVNFTAHPNLKRIMTPDDWIGHPLRKDYAYPQVYNGIAHLRDGQRFEPPPAPKPAVPPKASA